MWGFVLGVEFYSGRGNHKRAIFQAGSYLTFDNNKHYISREKNDRIHHTAYRYYKHNDLCFCSTANSSCYVFLVESNKAISKRNEKDG